jgi:hypothetical protein
MRHPHRLLSAVTIALVLAVQPAAAAGGGQPDLQIKVGTKSYVGANVYDASGSGQSISTRMAKGQGKEFTIRLSNDIVGAPSGDQIRLKGCGNSAGYRVTYRNETTDTDVTSQMKAGTLLAATEFGVDIPPGDTVVLSMRITATNSAGDAKSCKVVATSTSNGNKDAVIGKVKLR